MNSVIRFSVRGVPATQGSMKAHIPKGWTRPIVTHNSPKTIEWRNLVALEARRVAPPEPWTAALAMEATFALRRPKSHCRPDGSLRPKAPLYPSGKPDTSKLIRAVEDALTGILYRDDSQIVEVIARKKYGNVGVEIELRQLTDQENS